MLNIWVVHVYCKSLCISVSVCVWVCEGERENEKERVNVCVVHVCVDVSVSHLEFMLVLLVDAWEQLGFAAVQGIDQSITLGHQTRLELHSVLLSARAHTREFERRKHSFFWPINGVPWTHTHRRWILVRVAIQSGDLAVGRMCHGGVSAGVVFGVGSVCCLARSAPEDHKPSLPTWKHWRYGATPLHTRTPTETEQSHVLFSAHAIHTDSLAFKSNAEYGL